MEGKVILGLIPMCFSPLLLDFTRSASATHVSANSKACVPQPAQDHLHVMKKIKTSECLMLPSSLVVLVYHDQFLSTDPSPFPPSLWGLHRL